MMRIWLLEFILLLSILTSVAPALSVAVPSELFELETVVTAESVEVLSEAIKGRFSVIGRVGVGVSSLNIDWGRGESRVPVGRPE